MVLAGITLPPNYGPVYVDQFNKTYVQLAAKVQGADDALPLKGVYGVAGSMQETDPRHRTRQQQVAANVLELINPLLKKCRTLTRRRHECFTG